MRKILEKMALLIIASLFAIALFFLSCPIYPLELKDNTNIWYKISSDELDPGALIALDMSKGYAITDGPYIYIMVKELGTDNMMTIVLPNGGYWHAVETDDFKKELNREFENLENYLKGEGGTEWKKD